LRLKTIPNYSRSPSSFGTYWILFFTYYQHKEYPYSTEVFNLMMI